MTECYIAAKISYILSFAFMQNYSNCSQIPSIFHFAIHVSQLFKMIKPSDLHVSIYD